MNSDKLRDDLDRLRAELARLAGNDPQARDKLDRLIADIEDHVGQPDGRTSHQGLIAGLRDAIRQFETGHPRATAILNDIMVTLSNMGI